MLQQLESARDKANIKRVAFEFVPRRVADRLEYRSVGRTGRTGAVSVSGLVLKHAHLAIRQNPFSEQLVMAGSV